MRFLADESCDFAVVTALRGAGHDVFAITEINPGAEDDAVLAMARSEARVVLTEDKDFGLLVYAGGHETAGVLLIRFPQECEARWVKRSSMSLPNLASASSARSWSLSQDARASRGHEVSEARRLTND